MAEQNNSDFFGEISALYGKMDKLLDKRGPDALVEHMPAAPEAADFPCLTDVVEPAPAKSASTKSGSAKPTPQQVATEAAGIEPSPELMAAIEARLRDLLARHQQEVDEAVRRIVQEELARRGK